MTRSTRNWSRTPGSFDPLHMRDRYPSTHPDGIPDLLLQRFDLPASFRLQPYRTQRPDQDRSILHFYLDDYRFETTWTRPTKAATHAARYYAACTPDFSLYPTWPRAAQVWNTYRSRWTGRHWQEQGLRVIPTVNWSDESSFDYCFAGIPPRQIVTISTPDTRKPDVLRRFETGWIVMLARLEPRLILVYGRMPFETKAPIIELPPEWLSLRGLGG